VAAAVANTVVEMQHPRLLIIEAYESRLCSGPETVVAAVVNTVVEVEMQHPRLLIIEANESRLCSGPETVAAAVVNTVVEVEDPTAQIINHRSI
jgi:inactivated superfamily I helicase